MIFLRILANSSSLPTHIYIDGLCRRQVSVDGAMARRTKKVIETSLQILEWPLRIGVARKAEPRATEMKADTTGEGECEGDQANLGTGPSSKEEQQVVGKLLEKIGAGKRAFAELYARCAKDVRGWIEAIAVRNHWWEGEEDTEDTVHDVFLRVDRSAPSFALKDGNPKGWLWKITQRACTDTLKRKRKRATEAGDPDEFPTSELAPPVLAENAEQLAMLKEAIERLPPENRNVVARRLILEMEMKCVACKEKIPDIDKARRLYYKGLILLRRELEKKKMGPQSNQEEGEQT